MSPPLAPLPLLLSLLLLLPLASCQAVGVQCPSMDGGVVCRMASAGFEFSDGCNTIRCGAGGEVSSTTLMLCEIPRDDTERTQCREQQQLVYSRLLNSAACPQLKADDVCVAAPADFHFTDGCNFVTCDGRGGVASSTMMGCENRRLSRKQQTACGTLLQLVILQLPPRLCDINATAVCVERGAGFHFSDGCNGITCEADGSYSTTLMMCNPASSNSVICQRAIAAVTRPAPKPEFACPQLQPARVCKPATIGFSYSDGCNSVQCARPGQAVSTMRYCPEPDSEPARAYCAEAVKLMEEKFKASRLHAECLRPQDACGSRGSARAYYNGCQYCICTAGASASTCMPDPPCPTFFGTDEEFKDECARRNAGILV